MRLTVVFVNIEEPELQVDAGDYTEPALISLDSLMWKVAPGVFVPAAQIRYLRYETQGDSDLS